MNRRCVLRPILLTLGAHAYMVGVYAYSRTTGNEAAYEQHQRPQYNKRSKKNGDIFTKTMAFESEKLALSQTALRDPTHQLAAYACGSARARVRT